jgi:hypothetical protein
LAFAFEPVRKTKQIGGTSATGQSRNQVLTRNYQQRLNQIFTMPGCRPTADCADEKGLHVENVGGSISEIANCFAYRDGLRPFAGNFDADGTGGGDL